VIGLIIAIIMAALPGGALAQSENARALEKLCARGDTLSCTNLAVLLKHGRGTPRDDPRALTLFLNACEKGVNFACGNVGEMTFKGRGIAVNEIQGAAIIKGACVRGDAWSCDTARLLGIKLPKKTPA
jgi:TPR repeat protein